MLIYIFSKKNVSLFGIWDTFCILFCCWFTFSQKKCNPFAAGLHFLKKKCNPFAAGLHFLKKPFWNLGYIFLSFVIKVT